MDTNQSLLEQAVAAARQKDFASARNLLKELIRQDPNNINAWLLAAHVVETRSDAIGCYKQVLRLDPGHAYAKEKLAQLQPPSPSAVPPSPPAVRPAPVQDEPKIPAQPPRLRRLEPRQPEPVNRPPVQPPPQPVVRPEPRQPDSLKRSQVQPQAAFWPDDRQTEIVQRSQAQPAPQVDIWPEDNQTDRVRPSQNLSAPRKKPKSNSMSGLQLLLGGLVVFLCFALAAMLAFSRGGQSLFAGPPTPSSEQLFNVLYTNSRAANAEDVAAYMATIHPRSPAYRETEETLPQLFAAYDLEFYFSNLQVTKLTKSEARVHFMLSTRRISGPPFRNNVVSGTMILRLDKGVWKIWNQDVDDVQYY